MVVMMPREAWTDERLDDLSRKVDDGFARVDTDIRELRGEINQRFDRLDARFDKLMFALLGFGGAMIVGLIGVLGAAFF